MKITAPASSWMGFWDLNVLAENRISFSLNNCSSGIGNYEGTTVVPKHTHFKDPFVDNGKVYLGKFSSHKSNPQRQTFPKRGITSAPSFSLRYDANSGGRDKFTNVLNSLDLTRALDKMLSRFYIYVVSIFTKAGNDAMLGPFFKETAKLLRPPWLNGS